MIFIDRYAFSSKLKASDPLQKVVFALLTLSVCLWADNAAISALVVFIMGGIIVFKGGTPFRFFVKLMLVPMSFLLLGVFAIAVNISGSSEGLPAAAPVAGIWVGFSPAGLKDAGRLFLKALGCVSCLYFLALSTPIADLLAALKKLRLPKLLTELMGLVYRFVFILTETAASIHHAQNCRLGYSSFSAAYRSLGSLASTLFIRSFKRSNELYTALEARGYEGELNVLEEKKYSGKWSGYIIAAAVNALLILLAVILK